MKFLDANGLALFTKKIFSKFVSNITGADNKITITKGDGTTNEINLNEVVKTDVIGEDPPDDDNSNKIPSTRWVQKFVTTMVFKLISKLAGTEETGVSSSGSFLGVNWLIAQNGYICLGKLFGGLILQWGLIVGSDKLVNIPTNITIKQLLYCNACDGISSFENDGIGYFLGVADVTPTNIIFRFKENPQTFRWFILSK